MKFLELINYLDREFPKSLSIPGDADGVDVCIDWDLEIGRVLIALDVSFEVIDYAARHGYNCIISHHAVISEPLQKLDLSSSAAKKAVMLAKNNICSAAFHTRLDCVAGGVNDSLIKALGIAGEGTEDLLYKPLNASPVPIGRIVNLRVGTDLEPFIGGIKKSLKNFYKKEFSCDASFDVSCAKGRGSIKKIGIVGGSGMFFAKTAAASGCDTFFTGEGKYHDILEIYESFGINIITAGHFETEAVVLPFIKQKISEGFKKSAADCFIGGPQQP